MKITVMTLSTAVLIALLGITKGFEDDAHTYRICQNRTTRIQSSKGYMCIEREMLFEMVTCSCSVSSPVGVLALTPRRDCTSQTRYTFNISDGSSFITDVSFSSLLISELNGTDNVSIFVRKSRSEEAEADTSELGMCIEFSSTNSSTMTVKCDTITRYINISPDKVEEKEVPLGAVLGSVIAVVLIANVFIIWGVVSYMKRRNARQRRWRPDIAHTMNQNQDKNGPGIGTTNAYVGIQSNQKGKTQDRVVTEGYEEVSGEYNQDMVSLSQTRTCVYSKGKDPDTKPTHNQKADKGRTIPVPANASQFVPDDEYEEVSVKTADKRADKTGKNSKAHLAKKTKPVTEDSLPQSYEDMCNPCGSVRDKRFPQPPASAQGVQNTYGNLEPVIQEKRGLKSKPTRGLKPSSSRKQALDVNPSIKQGTRKYRADPSCPAETREAQPKVPTEMYDNIASIMAQRSGKN